MNSKQIQELHTHTEIHEFINHNLTNKTYPSKPTKKKLNL